MREVFRSGANIGAYFRLEVGDRVESTESCRNDMKGLVVEIVESGDNNKVKGKILFSNKAYRKVGEIWDLSYMKRIIHPYCIVYRGKIENWRELI